MEEQQDASTKFLRPKDKTKLHKQQLPHRKEKRQNIRRHDSTKRRNKLQNRKSINFFLYFFRPHYLPLLLLEASLSDRSCCHIPQM